MLLARHFDARPVWIVAHDPLKQQVGGGGEAHCGAGVAVAGILHGVHGKDTNGVYSAAVEIGPRELLHAS